MNGQRGYQLNFYRKINHIIYTVMLQNVSQQHFTVRVNHIEDSGTSNDSIPETRHYFIYNPMWQSFLEKIAVLQ
jgi:hypothetical protein